jgi:hypothetical protein
MLLAAIQVLPVLLLGIPPHTANICVMLMGPVGLALVGAQGEADGYTWDCWKAVVLDDSVSPSCNNPVRATRASEASQDYNDCYYY